MLAGRDPDARSSASAAGLLTGTVIADLRAQMELPGPDEDPGTDPPGW